MKYNALKKCLTIAEVMCESVGVDKSDINVCFINRDRVTVSVEGHGAEVEMAIMPKGE